SVVRVRFREHVFQRFNVLIPLFAVAPILLGQLIILPGIFFALLEAVELFLLGNVNPELHQDHAAIHQGPLEFIDLPVSALPFLLLGKLLDALHQNPAIPSAIENPDATAWREPEPKATQPVVGLVPLGGWADRANLVAAWVQGLGQALDIASLPCRVFSFVTDTDRNSFFNNLALQFQQPQLVLFQKLLVLLLGLELLVEIQLVQITHGLFLFLLLVLSDLVVLRSRLGFLIAEHRLAAQPDLVALNGNHFNQQLVPFLE